MSINATIKYLRTTGTVNGGNYKYAAGLVGETKGNVTIQNCRSSVAITSTIDGDGTHGGFVGVVKNTTNINNCLFDGSISGSSTTNCGGFVGWNNSSLNISDSLMAGTLNISVDSNSATFSRSRNSFAIKNCY